MYYYTVHSPADGGRIRRAQRAISNPGDLPHTADRRLARLLDPVSREEVAGSREDWELGVTGWASDDIAGRIACKSKLRHGILAPEPNSFPGCQTSILLGGPPAWPARPGCQAGGSFSELLYLLFCFRLSKLESGMDSNRPTTYDYNH